MNLQSLKEQPKIVVGIIIFILICLWYGIHSYKKQPAAKSTPIVQAQAVKVAPLTEKISAVGNLSAAQDIYVSSKIDGYITEINFKDGQEVKAGDLLFQLDNTKEQAELASAEADYQQAKNKLDRMQKLIKSHYVSAQDVDISKAEVQAKLTMVKTAQDNLNKKSITAPFGGSLGSRTVSVGDYITPGLKLVELVDRGELQVDYSVPEKYFRAVKMDQPVSITTAGLPGKAFWGKVIYIAPFIDPQTHTLTLEANIPNTGNELAPGLFVQVQEVVRNNPHAILVPEQSLVKSPDKVIVYRVVDSKAVATPVQIGASQEGYVEILSGLSSKDSIVVAGQDKLKDGDVVQAAS